MRKKILSYAIGPLGAACLGFITLPIITWFYSVEDVGRVSMLQVTTNLFVILFCLGLDQAYGREYFETNNKPKLLRTVLVPGLLVASFVLLLFSTLQPSLISIWLYDEPSWSLSILTSICFVLALVCRFLSVILRMQDRAISYSLSQVFPKIIFLGCVLLVVFSGEFASNIDSLVYCFVLSSFAALLLLLWSNKDELLVSLSCKIDLLDLKKLITFGLPLVAGGLASWGLSVMDRLFLRSLSSFSELGVYSVTVSVAGVATIFAGIFNTIWAPLVYKWISEGRADLKKISAIAENLLASIYFSTAVVGLFSWVFPLMLPSEYSAIEYLILACLVGPLLYTLSEVTSIGIAISRRTLYSMLASVMAMLINVVGNYFLVPTYGAAGAAASTAFSFWFFYILRTEFSIYVWKNMARAKAYFVTGFMLCVIVVNTLFLQSKTYQIVFSVAQILLGFFLFKSTVSLGGIMLLRVLRLYRSSKS